VVSVRDRLTDLWRRLRVTRPRIKHVSFVESPSDVPDDLPRQGLVVVGMPEYPKWAVFECPCGRGHRLMLSLQRGHRVSWRLRLGARGPSLSPSIDLIADFRCHFWLHEGRVRWVRGWRLVPRRAPDSPSETGQVAQGKGS
jgi:hypothetical protein